MLQTNRPIIWLSLVLIVLTLQSCDYRKYNEGPFFSVYSTEARLANTWQWDLALEGNTPLTGFYSDSTVQFLENETVQICSTEGTCREGVWSLVSKRNRLQMVFGTNTLLFDIQMLKRKEMWLSMTDDDGIVTQWELSPLEP